MTTLNSSDSTLFEQCLHRGDLAGIVAIPKSDLHNHASNGGNVRFFNQLHGVRIDIPAEGFGSIIEMERWAKEKIKRHTTKRERYEAAFAQAENDGIKVLSMTIFRDEMDEFGTCGEFIEMYSKIKEKYAPNVLFLPEISYNGESEASQIDFEYNLMDEIFSYNYFKSIELCYGTLRQEKRSFTEYKKLFRKAKSAGLRLKAHAGEFDTADDVMRAVEELELDEVHHGISAATSPQIMKWLADNKIQLNICFTSNILLRRVPNMKEHPIRILYDYGVSMTVNTDDMLIFDQSVSQEYLNLYNCGLMNASELDKLRICGLGNYLLMPDRK